jgi:hypothetical protein
MSEAISKAVKHVTTKSQESKTSQEPAVRTPQLASPPVTGCAESFCRAGS